MRLPELIPGTLIRRYRRFFADVRLADGEMVTAHVPNTGSLLSCAEPGMPVWLRDDDKPERRFRFTWTLVQPCRALCCVDTGVPNRVVYEQAVAQRIPQLTGYREYLREVALGEHSRADMCCRVHESDMLGRAWVEVKSTTLVRGRTAYFPDAVTSRGLKHLHELMRVVGQGERGVQVFFIQRGDCDVFRPADDIDAEYGRTLRAAAAAGVEILALQAQVKRTSITIKRQIPVELASWG